MTDFKPEAPLEVRRRDEVIELGGIRFVISNNDYGANLAVFGDLGKGWIELVRFQDYADEPHYHAPVGGWIGFDRVKLGEPLAWWMDQVENHLAEMLEEAGFAELIPGIDLDEVRANLGQVTQAMIECVPESYARVPGEGVRRINWSADEAATQKRNESSYEFGGLLFEVFFDRDLGATMQIYRTTGGKPIEMVRLDDYDENPHYHSPVGVFFNFEREELGEPLAWFIDQLRNHFPELLEKARYGQLIPKIDFAAISKEADSLYAAMAARVPRGMIRTPGIGLQRVEAPVGRSPAVHFIDVVPYPLRWRRLD